jgi:hypothetical protein
VRKRLIGREGKMEKRERERDSGRKGSVLGQCTGEGKCEKKQEDGRGVKREEEKKKKV